MKVEKTKSTKEELENKNQNQPIEENILMNQTVSKAFWLVVTLLCIIIAIAVLVPYVRTTVTNSTSNPPVIPTSYIIQQHEPAIGQLINEVA
ncbi:hypothetical protein [Paenibacillus ihuae]|uniref:hypothetical protein n=1 Tax=Paenibacillus ihuae TaxID=1232431 RepID=UPI0006D58F1B|nr:hypothetical protein [Paenibacillus ihuae]